MSNKDISELQVSSIIGKTIRAVTISDNSTKLVFTDGGTMKIWNGPSSDLVEMKKHFKTACALVDMLSPHITNQHAQKYYDDVALFANKIANEEDDAGDSEWTKNGWVRKEP
ncbi:MAG TPA: hypothetical protein EYN67_11700 [Flavobacteriales bacterium]|nr:hypothetical protein [Flavobacteriales bacterium]